MGIMHKISNEIHAQKDEIHKNGHFLLTNKSFYDYNKNINLFKDGRQVEDEKSKSGVYYTNITFYAEGRC